MSDSDEQHKKSGQWVAYVFVAMAAFVLIGYFLQIKGEEALIDECPKFTIGYTTTIESKTINYRYWLNGQSYTASWRVNPRSTKEVFTFNRYPKDFIGQRFLVRCNCTKPGVSEIVWSHNIPETVTTAPVAGWDSIPRDFRKTEF